MITELHAGGTLRHWHSSITRNQNPLLQNQDFIFHGHLAKELKTVSVAVSQALRYLHKTKIIHRDVRPDNIFVRLDERTGSIEDAVLADLGLFCFAGDSGFAEDEYSENASIPTPPNQRQPPHGRHPPHQIQHMNKGSFKFDRSRGLADNPLEELLRDSHTVSGDSRYWPPEVVAQMLDERIVKGAMDMR